MAKKASAKKKEEAISLTPPALNAYLDRVGAELLSFRRAMIKERSKGDTYYIERTLIRIGSDGAIDCSRKEHAPTKEEVEAIAEAYKSVKLPKSICATQAGYDRWLGGQSGDHERFFMLWDRSAGGVRMVQERVTLPDGSKIFVPWTLWDDGEWRAMEPDGPLPLWKAKKKTRPRIMIHEGCKAARFVTELVADPERLAAHPWGTVLEQYDHMGMIGGALAPHRTDYAELTRERPIEVVYVCDNDYAGESALQEVSRHYGAALVGVTFGKRWPVSWDLADPMPGALFTKSGRYIGPTFKELMRPATRATELVAPEGGKGRPTAVLKRAFKEEWVHCVTPEVYIHKGWPNRILINQEFNNWVAPYSDVDDTARLVRKDAASKSAILKYDPGGPSGIYGESGRYINTHVPSLVESEKGSAAPWLDFMERLVPGSGDRTELLRWVATLIGAPSIKMTYGVLLISETQGIGKGTLGEKILAPLIGDANVSYPSENEIVESNFNYWLAHKRLAVVHEIYAGHSSKAYNRLKSIITDRYITVSKKFQANYEIENWMHVFACSNSMRAIQLSADDRRWFVPKVTEEKQESGYWAGLNKWLGEEGGLGIIKRWAGEWLAKNDGVLKGADAPWSETKGEVVTEGYSPGMTLVADFLDRVKFAAESKDWVANQTRPSGANGGWKSPGIAFYDTDLVAMIHNHVYGGRQSDRLERTLTLRKVAKQKGWFVHPDRFREGGANHGRLICSNKEMTAIHPDILKSAMKFFDVKSNAATWWPI